MRREGVELSSGFTANIDVQMVVGGVEETVTVTGATPTVDIQNVRSQNVMDDETLNLLPNSQNIGAFAAMTLGSASVAARVVSMSVARVGRWVWHQCMPIAGMT